MLLEASRQDLLNKSKHSDKGKQRLQRRFKSKVIKSTQEMNKIDMNKLFKKGILDIQLKIIGETDDYYVKISFGGFLDALHVRLEREQQFDIRTITQTLIECSNREDTYIHCSCLDYKYRFHYWSSRHDYESGDKQPSNGKWIRNPEDKLGSGCKHILLALSNLGWIQTVARVIFNYVEYMEKHYENMYAKIIYPAIYNTKYTKPTQLDMRDSDDLRDDDIKIANDEKRKSSQFKVGNKQGYKFVPNENPNEKQQELEFNPDDEF